MLLWLAIVGGLFLLLLIAATWMIAYTCLKYFGGVEKMFESVHETSSALLSTLGPNNLFTPHFLIASFLAIILLPVVGATVTVGLMAAAMSTADSQIFALGAELRSLLSGDERKIMLLTKIAIVGFAMAALVFAVGSSDELVLLARVSFMGTALLGPLVLAAVVSPVTLGLELLVTQVSEFIWSIKNRVTD